MLDQVTQIIKTDKAVAANQKRLSICLRSNGFSFFTANLDRELLSYGEADFDFDRPMGELTQALKAFLAEQQLSAFSFAQMRLVFCSDHFVWIPEHLYDAARDRQYLHMVSSPESSLGVYHIASRLMQSYMVFSAPAMAVTAFKVALPGVDVHCQHSVLASAELLRRSSAHPLVLMHRRPGRVDFEACYNGKLLFSNTFSSADDTESLYHGLDVMKQLHLETPDMELAICGEVDRSTYAMMQHYFPNVSLYTGEPVTSEHPELQRIPTYKYILNLI